MGTRSRSYDRGDTLHQIQHRDAFLSKGFYDPLLELLAKVIGEVVAGDEITIVDAGVGSGFYLRDLTALLNGRGATVTSIGLDISKNAAAFAASRSPDAFIAVSDLRNRWPIKAKSADVVLGLFSPHNFTQVCMTLKLGGVFLLVFPMDKHLQELRSRHGLIGIEPHKKDRYEGACNDRFKTVEFVRLTYKIDLDPKTVEQLVMMGPNALHLKTFSGPANYIRETVDFGLFVCRHQRVQ